MVSLPFLTAAIEIYGNHGAGMGKDGDVLVGEIWVKSLYSFGTDVIVIQQGLIHIIKDGVITLPPKIAYQSIIFTHKNQ